tara:strand:- start:6962 stop:8566 length:1605 start_codon:yes stop_codon:yes gene_type:complete
MAITEEELSRLPFIIIKSATDIVEAVVCPVSLQVGTATKPANIVITGKAFFENEIDISSLISVDSLSVLNSVYLSGSLSGFVCTGSAIFKSGISGSLTHLTDGTSYLVAGSNVTITSGSTGQITIAAAGGSGSPGGSDTQLQYNDGGSFGGIGDITWDDTDITIGTVNGDTKLKFRDSGLYINSPADGKLHIDSDNQVLIMSGGGATSYDESSAADVSFYVSGSTPSFDLAAGGATVFGGDTHVSGGMRVGGSILSVSEYIDHIGDPDTFIRFEDDTIYFDAGGRNFIKIIETGTDKLIINNGALDIDLQVKGNSSANLLRTDAANDSVYFGANSAAGVDNSFWVSGSIGSRGTSIRGTAVFGGDSIISGSIYVDRDIEALGAVKATSGLSGSLTRLSDGKSFIEAGANVTVTSASNGSITIAATSGGGAGGSGDYQSKTSNFTATTNEYMFGVSTSGGAITGTLPAASSAGSGKQYIFKDSGGHAGDTGRGIYIATDSNSEKIDGAAAASINVSSGSISLMTDGSNWFVFGVS